MLVRSEGVVLRRVLTCGVALSVLSASGAMAQDPTAELADDYGEDVIIVSPNKRAQTLQEVPVAVTVVGAQVIDDAEIIDIIDLQASVSSLRVTQLQTSSSTTFAIRGFGNGSNNPGIDPSVGVFVDGVFRSRVSSSLFDFPTLERVEVLRGPQSTLFGKNVSVGAISITTEAPSFDWEGSVEATVGNLDTVRFRGTVSGPVTDTLAFRLSGTTNNREGTYTNIVDGSENINERDRWSLRGQLLWEPTDSLSFRLIGDMDELEDACCGAVFLEQGPITQGLIAGTLGGAVPPVDADPSDRLVAVNFDPINELEGKGISLQADWDLGWGEVTSITAYRNQTDLNAIDGDFTGADLVNQTRRSEFDTFTQELRVAGEYVSDYGTFNWLAGGFYFNEQLDFDSNALGGADFRAYGDALLAGVGTNFAAVEGATQLIAALTADSAVTGPALFPELAPAGGPTVLPSGLSYGNGLGPVGAFEQDNQLYSLFAQTDWAITDRLTITGGIGYTRDRKDVTGVLTQTDPFQNFDLEQFATSGISLEAAALLGDAIGTPFDLTNPTSFFTAAAIAAATDPMFALDRAGALGTAVTNAGLVGAGLAAPSPFLAAGLGLTQLDPFQIFQLAEGFPAPGVAQDDGNTLNDDGFVVDDAFTYTARVAYDITSNINGYFSYATGYKPPASNLALTSASPVQATDGSIVGRFAGGEDVTVFELGFKAAYDWGFINIAVFDQTVEDFQSVVFTGVGQQLSNAGEQTVQGFEIEAAYSPIDPLNLSFGLTYLDPEFDSFESAPCPAAGFVPITDEDVVAACAVDGVSSVDISGTRPAGIHDVSLTTAASYRFDLPRGMTLTPRVEYLYESETALFEPENGSAPTREVNQLNANILLRTEQGFDLNLWGRNLTDDDYNLAFFNSTAQVGSFNGYIAQPRTWGVSVSKDF